MVGAEGLSPTRVVVIGGAYGGAFTARALAEKLTPDQVHITVIEAKGHFYCIPGTPRALVDKSFASNIWAPLDKLFNTARVNKKFPDAPSHQVVHGTVSEVHAKHVIVQETGEFYPYDYLVVATGIQFHKPLSTAFTSRDDGMAWENKYAEQVARAKKVLVVGGGPTGVEIAGEIKHAFSDTQVTLVHSSDQLLDDRLNANFRQRLTERARQVGIQLVLGDRVAIKPTDPTDPVALPETDSPLPMKTFVTEQGRTLEADWVIQTVGGKVNTSFMAPLLANAPAGVNWDTVVEPTSNALRVYPTLQLAHPDLTNILAVGDVNNFPCIKTAFRTMNQSKIAAKNLATLILNDRRDSPQDCTALKLAPYVDNLNALIVTLGPKAAVGLLPIMGGRVFGDWVCRLIKSSDAIAGSAWSSVGSKLLKT
ncbi:hypothetical protein H4R34_005336 [Dimargaris verticillata]|uniref:FAD/NAD(P)-binding domain-containing protein n=1 Tax=Dimargaris verticillata TaxID=2761393 RepID=A0A9W8B2G2_9FUNG|nr:hypothetical protein H4R34_005336 [Dimargaris verticillata]